MDVLDGESVKLHRVESDCKFILTYRSSQQLSLALKRITRIIISFYQIFPDGMQESWMNVIEVSKNITMGTKKDGLEVGCVGVGNSALLCFTAHSSSTLSGPFGWL